MCEVITVDQAIDQLRDIAATSPIGGNTCFYVCIPGLEYQPITKIKMDRSQDGCIALAMQPFDVEAHDQQTQSEAHNVHNFYVCPHCDTAWDDWWSCACNDQCPNCGVKDIQPLASE